MEGDNEPAVYIKTEAHTQWLIENASNLALDFFSYVSGKTNVPNL